MPDTDTTGKTVLIAKAISLFLFGGVVLDACELDDLKERTRFLDQKNRYSTNDHGLECSTISNPSLGVFF